MHRGVHNFAMFIGSVNRAGCAIKKTGRESASTLDPGPAKNAKQERI